MKQEIQERLQSQTTYLTAQANLFSLVVETTETDLSKTMTFDGDTVFRTTIDNKHYGIQSVDNLYSGDGHVIVFIDLTDPVTTETRRIADLTVYKDGNVNENYYNPPRADRSAIFELFGDIEDAINGYIDENALDNGEDE